MERTIGELPDDELTKDDHNPFEMEADDHADPKCEELYRENFTEDREYTNIDCVFMRIRKEDSFDAYAMMDLLELIRQEWQKKKRIVDLTDNSSLARQAYLLTEEFAHDSLLTETDPQGIYKINGNTPTNIEALTDIIIECVTVGQTRRQLDKLKEQND